MIGIPLSGESASKRCFPVLPNAGPSVLISRRNQLTDPLSISGEVTIQVNVPQDSLLPSTDNVYLGSMTQETPGEEDDTSLNLANQRDERVVYGDFRSTLVARSAPPFACTANPERHYIDGYSLPNSR